VNAIASTLMIDPEFRDLIRPLEDDERDQLHESLALDGCISPLVVWKGENILVDGHNRYAYCVAHDTPFSTVEKSFVSRDDVKAFMLLNQLARRNITPTYASVLRGELYAIQKKYEGSPTGANQHTEELPQNEAVPPSPRTSEIIAKKTGVSRATVERDGKLVEALKKLGISLADFAAGKVLDANGKKRSKKSIMEEAFPPKPKKEDPATAPSPAPQDDEPEPLVVDGEKPQRTPNYIPSDALDIWNVAKTHLNRILKNDIHREQALNACISYCHGRLETKRDALTAIVATIPRLTKDEIKSLIETLNTRWT
jgi:hypothetical protein